MMTVRRQSHVKDRPSNILGLNKQHDDRQAVKDRPSNILGLNKQHDDRQATKPRLGLTNQHPWPK